MCLPGRICRISKLRFTGGSFPNIIAPIDAFSMFAAVCSKSWIFPKFKIGIILMPDDASSNISDLGISTLHTSSTGYILVLRLSE